MIESVELYYKTALEIIGTIKNSEVVTIGPKWSPGEKNWVIATLRVEIRFHSGHTLVMTDNFSRKNKMRRELERKFSYYFGEENDAIFLFDTHGKFGEPCHAHLITARGTRLEDGDPRLHGFSVSEIDFPAVVSMIEKYFDDEGFPWNDTQNNLL